MTTAVPAAPRRVETGFTRDYTAFMHCRAGDDWLGEVERQVGSWLREKDFDVAFSVDGDQSRPDARVSVRRAEQGRVRDLRITLVEDSGRDGVWTTEILAHDEPGEGDWIYLSVRNSLGRFVKVPRVAKYLMDVLPLHDGPIEFTASAPLLRADQVDELVEALTDPSRTALMFVAGTDERTGLPLSPFVKQVDRWAREVYGLAKVFVLDPAASAQFAARVGERFQAPAWTIRTYVPGVDLSDPANALTHRILGTQRLVDQSDRRTQYLLGDIARDRAARRVLPRAVQQVQRRFERIENRKLVASLETPAEPVLDPVVDPASVSSNPPEPAAASEADTQVGLVKRILGLAEITEHGLRELAARLVRPFVDPARAQLFETRVKELQDRVEDLEDERASLLEAIDEAQYERDLADLDVDQREARIRFLTSRLRADNDYESEYLEVPAEFLDDTPSSFGELLARIDDLPAVEFTGDEDIVERLNANDGNDAALRTAWKAVLALCDYVRARDAGDCTVGLDGYLDNTPNGYRTFPPGKFAQNETGATMTAFGKERIFSVPTDVRAGGEVEMTAHFKLARIGMVSPRMHVFDAHPDKPVVYIGYIGPHLTNTQS